MKSSEAMTPESRAIARSGTFSLARARTRAVQVESYRAATSAWYGGGASGDTESPEQAPSSMVPVARAASTGARTGAGRLLVMVDADVRIDEPFDPRLVELLHRVDPCPRRQRDLGLHPRIRRKHNVLVIALYDRLQLRDDLRALAVVLRDHAAVLQVVHLELAVDGPRVDAPRRNVRQMRSRRRRIRVVRHVRRIHARDVEVPLVGHLGPGEVRLRPIGEVADDDRHQHDSGDGNGRALALRDSPARFRLPVASGHVRRSCGGSVWESNPSTVCLERSTGFEVREAHRVPRRFRRCFDVPEKPPEFTIDPPGRPRPSPGGRAPAGGGGATSTGFEPLLR